MGALDDLAKALLASNQGAEELITAENPYLKLKAVPDTLTGLTVKAAGSGKFKTKDLIAAALLSGLGSGVADSFAQDYQGRAQDAALKTLTSGINGEGIDRPAELSPGLFKKLSNQGELFRIQSQFGQAQRAQDLQDAITKAGLTKAAEVKGENAAWDQINETKAPVSAETPPVAADAPAALLSQRTVAPGAAAVVPAPSQLEEQLGRLNPNSPQYKRTKDLLDNSLMTQKRVSDEEDSRRKEITSDKAYSSVAAITSVLPTLETLAEDNTATSDIPFIYKFIQAQDGGVVKEGEFAKVEGASPLLAKFANQLNAALNGQSGLSTTAKRQMVEEMKAAGRAQLDALKKHAESVVKIGTARGGKRENIFPLDFTTAEAQLSPVRYTAAQMQEAGYSPAEISAFAQQGRVK